MKTFRFYKSNIDAQERKMEQSGKRLVKPAIGEFHQRYSYLSRPIKHFE